jgi:hypothetical protein
MFIIGITLITKKRNYSFIILASIVFTVYQFLGWEFSSKRSLSNLELNSVYSMHLVPHDSGAFSSKSFVNLILTEKKHLFLIKKIKIIKSYENIYSGKLVFKESNVIDVELVTYSKEKISESINIKDKLSDTMYFDLGK